MIANDSFVTQLCADEVFIADNGYKGVDYCIMPGGWGHVINKQISKIRARHETVNRKFKEYKAIGERSRHTQGHGGKSNCRLFAGAMACPLRVETLQ